MEKLYQKPDLNVLVIRFEDSILYLSGDRNVADKEGGVSGTDAYDDSHLIL